MATIYVINVLIVIVLLSCARNLSAYRPSGYLGCYNDLDSPYRNLNGTYRISETNTGDKCKRYCSSEGYRYAGTEYAEECYCGNVIRNKNLTDGCNHRCLGNLDEICGGDWRINIYDTWQKTSSTTLQQTTMALEQTTTRPSTITTMSLEQTTTRPSTTTKMALEQTTTLPSTTTTVAPPSSVVAEASTGYFISSGIMTKGALDQFVRENEDSTHTEVYISIPATVAIVGIIAVVALWIVRRRGRKHHLGGGSGSVNHSNTVTGTEAEVKKDDDNVNVYDLCEAAGCSNRFYQTPVMSTMISYNKRGLETPYMNSTDLHPVISMSVSQNSGEDRHYFNIGETEKGANQYESITPNCVRSENDYTALKQAETGANLYESITIKPNSYGCSENDYTALNREPV